MRTAAFAVLALFVPAISFAQTATPTPAPFASDARPMLEEPSSIADPDGADAIVFNPAGLLVDDASEAVYVHSDRPQPNVPGDGDAFFLKSSRAFNLGIEWARPAKNTSRPLFTLSSGIPIGRTFAIGYGLTTTMGKTFAPYSFDTWEFGGLWRPTRWTSFGATAWNAFREQSTPGLLDLRPRYAGAVAIRPLTNMLTLSVDAARTDGQKHVDLRYALRAEPIPGLSLYVSADDAKRYTGGLSFSFSHARIGTTAFRDENGKYMGTATRVQSSQRRQPTVVHVLPTYAKATVGGSLPDQSPDGLFTKGAQTLPDVLWFLWTARHDKNLDGVVLELDGFGGGLARAQEVRSALLATKAAGKKVLCYLDSADFRTYYVAAACDRIALNPAGMIDVSGVASELGYVKGTLDKLGVEVETARVGPYKGAPEPLIQKEPSKETLEVANAMLDASFDQRVAGIAQGRNLSEADVRAAVDGGFFDAASAKEHKLVDYVCYPDELEKEAKDYLKPSAMKLSKYMSQAPASPDWGAPPRIAVVYADGGIASGESRSTPLTGEQVLGSDTLVRALKEVEKDGSIRAVVLRVDSPGGDGFASDEVWHEVEQVKKKKPVVVSMGDVAASGGYYISQGANLIFAEPGTITGSIGVFALKPNFQGTYEKLDYRTYLLSRGKFSQLFTTSRPWTPEEKDEAGRLIDTFYRDFIAKAAKGRKTTPEAIDAVGRGHVWMGEKAKELKLVDELGGIEDAFRKARELAHVPKNRRVEWVSFPKEQSALERLTKRDEIPDDAKAELRAISAGTGLATLELLQSFGNGPVSFSMDASAWSHPAKPAPFVAREKAANPFWPLPDPR